MKYIIDGHNLIPNIPGLTLSDLDDEVQLIRLIQEYCRLSRSQAELFFDGAPPAYKLQGGGGSVHMHFVRKGTSADDAIIQYMHHAGQNKQNLTLVTSDHRIHAEARSLGIKILESPMFARVMIQMLRAAQDTRSKAEPELSSSEVDQWLEIFGSDRNKNS